MTSTVLGTVSGGFFLGKCFGEAVHWEGSKGCSCSRAVSSAFYNCLNGCACESEGGGWAGAAFANRAVASSRVVKHNMASGSSFEDERVEAV